MAVPAAVAPTLLAQGNDSGGHRPPGTTVDTVESLVPMGFGGGNTSGPISAAACLTAKGQRIDFEVETFIAEPIPFDTTQITNPHNRSNPEPGDPAPTLANGAHPPAIGFDWYASQSQGMPTLEECAPPLRTTMQPAASFGYAVRRLTPRECERLQGYPDDYTAIRYRGKPATDGPRYKALGNSWAVNCARWIGRRIELVEDVAREIREGGQ